MERPDTDRLARTGGLSCIAGVLCYLAAAFLPLSDTAGYALIMLWPVLSIVFAWAIRSVLASRRESFSNSLAFVFACIAFGTVASMVSIQLAVRMGAAEFAAASSGADAAAIDTARRVARMVDLGMDVSWDYFIGSSLFFLGFALAGDARFGKVWGALTSGFGIALVVLNTITFPWPPDTRGLFDIGPFIGLFLLAFGIRLTVLGFRPAQSSSVRTD